MLNTTKVTVFLAGLIQRSMKDVNSSKFHPAAPFLGLHPKVFILNRGIQTKTIKCWNCGIEKRNVSELFCEKCNILQTPQEKDNYFKLFNLDEIFHVDDKLLAKKYKDMQRVLHPDKFSNKGVDEKKISEDYSSLVNKAYAILQSPIKRAVHLLHLKGENIEESQTIDEPEFLMEIMELNEKVEAADTAEKIRELNKKNKETLDNFIRKINESFERNDLKSAKAQIIKMKYFVSISTYINSLMREKGIVD